MALFKKKTKNEDIIEETGLNPDMVSGSGEEETGLVKTTLVYHPDWELTSQEKYVYMYQHQKLPLLEKNQISIKGVKLIPYNDGFVVVALLRNTLSKAIKFERIDLILMDENSQPVAKKQFELDSLGELPPLSCMPWRFLFTKEDTLAETIPEEGWSIVFELKQPTERKHVLDLADSWEEQLNPVQKDQLEKLVDGLPKLSSDEVNMVGLEAKFTAEETLVVTILLRNGSSKELQFEQIPLAVEDAAGDIICQGGFKLEDFKVKPNSTKPWTFIFPKELIVKNNPDLSSWKVSPPAKKTEN